MSRKFLNVQYRFICVSSHKFFGLRKEWVGRNSYFITDLEKTILDCLDYPEFAGGFTEAVKGLYFAQEKLDKEKLWQYALQLNNNTVIKRIGYLSEILELHGFESFRANARKILLPKYTALDPMSPKIGVHLHRWRLLLNLKEEEIKAIARIQY
jgi:predicted transcriptional regulator of viral defense system